MWRWRRLCWHMSGWRWSRVVQAEGDRPYAGCNFLVDIGTRGSREIGFCEVVFPEFRLHEETIVSGKSNETEAGGLAGLQSNIGRSSNLIVRRGVTGSRDLYDWWHRARLGRAPKRRTVKVTLLAEDHKTAILTWRFRNVRPVSLTYSSLNSVCAAVLMESIELAFESMEIDRQGSE